MYRVELKEAFPLVPLRFFLPFLMYRVELKVPLTLIYQHCRHLVPNVFLMYRVELKAMCQLSETFLRIGFLMYRVELKVNAVVEKFVKRVEFLMYRVELKEAFQMLPQKLFG